MSGDAILDQVFPTRARAVLALHEPISAGSAAKLQSVAVEAQRVADAFGRAPAALRWHAFAAAIDIVRLLIEWHEAVIAATTDADRFLRAARARLKALREEPAVDPFAKQFIGTLAVIDGEVPASIIDALRANLARIPMPVSVFADPDPQQPDWVEKQEEEAIAAGDLVVAFVEFKVNDEPVERIQSLRAREMHDLGIVVRVSRWPEGATSLALRPISIEPLSSYELPDFSFNRPSGEPPFLFQQRGRMVLHTPQNLRARPFEFMYTAEFRPVSVEKPISIAGQRTLRLDGSDVSRHPLTGYPGIDARLVVLRDTLRSQPMVSELELSDLLEVVVPLANLMGQAVQDARFPKAILENEFQREVRGFLRQHPGIGSLLEEQAHAGGGRTDLSFKGIRIELKSETVKKLKPEDCKQYVAQAGTYAIGTNRRVAVLCVLDCSPKKDVPFPAEDGLHVFPVDTGTSPVFVVSLLVQGNLAKPSSHSR